MSSPLPPPPAAALERRAPPIDATRDLRELAALAGRPAAVGEVLDRALAALQSLVPYDLAAVLELQGDELRVRAARGLLADERVRAHHIPLKSFPTVRRSMETRRPIALLDHHHASAEGDPYDGLLDLPHGHSCMVVPLFAGERALGAMTFDRRECAPYPAAVVELAGVYGQIVSLAMAYAEQAELLDRYRERLEEQNRLLEAEVGGADEAGEQLEGSRSPAMRALARLALQVAPTDAPVLILGETGSGKEVLAQALHAWSTRKSQPFIKVNCAAIPESLVESELFGHVKGAFSGATASRPGRFLVANGGTLLLDELGELPLSIQAKLLRVLQDGTFDPVGADRPVKVDVRLLAATHVGLEEAVRAGRFREDLYYRLAVFPLRIPPLRERVEDIEPITRSVLARIRRRTGRGPWSMHRDALHLLAGLPWPGNVRQLVNVLERATILVPRGELTVDSVAAEAGPGLITRRLVAEVAPVVPPPAAPPAPAVEPAPVGLADAEREHIRRTLEQTQGRIYGKGGAAERLGLKPSTLQSRMQKLGLRRVGEVGEASSG
jgi:transcriptional regulator with GAF, ATPase, and Fis domain